MQRDINRVWVKEKLKILLSAELTIPTWNLELSPPVWQACSKILWWAMEPVFLVWLKEIGNVKESIS